MNGYDLIILHRENGSFRSFVALFLDGLLILFLGYLFKGGCLFVRFLLFFLLELASCSIMTHNISFVRILILKDILGSVICAFSYIIDELIFFRVVLTGVFFRACSIAVSKLVISVLIIFLEGKNVGAELSFAGIASLFRLVPLLFSFLTGCGLGTLLAVFFSLFFLFLLFFALFLYLTVSFI